MEYSLQFRTFGLIFSGLLDQELRKKPMKQAIMAEYRAVVGRADDIGKNNVLLSSYALAAFFIALDRKSGRTPEENYRMLAANIQKSRMVKLFMGSDADGYLAPKRMEKRFAWSAESHKRRYPNDWVVDILPATADYDLGYDYLHCGVCCLCRDEGCFPLATWLCKLDFLLSEMVGLRLTRTTTLADGGSKCDFRFHRR